MDRIGLTTYNGLYLISSARNDNTRRRRLRSGSHVSRSVGSSAADGPEWLPVRTLIQKTWNGMERDRRIGWQVFASVLLIYVGTTGGSLTTTDAVVTYQLTQSIIKERTLALPDGPRAEVARQGVDGRFYAPFGIAQSIYNIPFFLAGRTAQVVTGFKIGNQDTIPKAAVAVGNLFPAAAAVWLAYLFALRLTGHPRNSALAALALGFGTMLWPYSKFGFNAPLATFAMLGATYHLWVGIRTTNERALVWSGGLLGCAVLTRHEMILGLVPYFLWLMIESRRDWSLLVRRAMLLGAPVLAAGIMWGSYNFVRFGNPLDAGYLQYNAMGFGEGLADGVWGLLFSPGDSVFVYAPVTLLGVIALVSERDRRTAWLIGLLVGLFVMFYAAMGNWYGGRSYGPRYLVPLMPYFCIPLAPWLCRRPTRLARVSVVTVVIISSIFQLPGVMVDYSRVSFAPAPGQCRTSLPSRSARLLVHLAPYTQFSSRTRGGAAQHPVPAGRRTSANILWRRLCGPGRIILRPAGFQPRLLVALPVLPRCATEMGRAHARTLATPWCSYDPAKDNS